MKGFTFTCNATYEDGVKAILSCPSMFFKFIDTPDLNSLITYEDAIDAIYGSKDSSNIMSDDPLERVYKKKG